MPPRIWLVALVAWCCTACGPVDLLGLDLNRPSDAKAYIAGCARGQAAMYCQAMLPTLSRVSGPVTVLVPNNGDTEITAVLQADLQRQGLREEEWLGSPAADRFARANIFAASKLSTGTMQTLDGKTHTVSCHKAAPNQREMCTVDGQLSGWSHMEFDPKAVGSVYATVSEQAEGRWYLPF